MPPSKKLKLQPYEYYVEINGGEFCGICGTTKKPDGRRLHRDHDHKTGDPRGLLCYRCNRALPDYVDLEWLLRAAAYLTRYLRRRLSGR